MKGATSKYATDCRIRAVRELPFVEALLALGLPPDAPEIVLQGGIGTLVMRPGSTEFTPAPTLRKMAASLAVSLVTAIGAAVTGDPVLATVQVRESRLVICRACPLWDAEAGRCRSCGCNGTAKAALADSRCPDERW